MVSGLRLAMLKHFLLLISEFFCEFLWIENFFLRKMQKTEWNYLKKWIFYALSKILENENIYNRFFKNYQKSVSSP